MTPKTWKEMIDRSKELELGLGDGIKKSKTTKLRQQYYKGDR